MRRRIAVTGIGLVTPLGNDRASTWSALLARKSGIGPITKFDAGGFTARIGAEVKGFVPQEDKKLLRSCAPFASMALAAAEEAMRDAGIRPTPADAERWGLVCGAGMMTTDHPELVRFYDEFAPNGQIDYAKLGAKGTSFISATEFSRQQVNSAVGVLLKRYGILGYANSVHTACASGGQALGLGMRAIRRGDADRVLAGGYDSMLNPIGLGAFCLLGALSTDNENPGGASRPFDLTRNGFVLGEGAGFLILEEWSLAVARKARIYAEFAGEGNSVSAYRITDSHPSGDGPIQAMHAALRDAGVTTDDVDYINAHGTSTKMNDACETNAIKAVFGARATKIPTSSTKSQMGHLIAAAGAVEGAVCALAIRENRIPMTANLKQRDPECDLDYVGEGPRELPVRVALSNSFGFGGSNNCLVFRKP